MRQFFKHTACQYHGFAVPSFNRLFHPAHPCLHLDVQVGISLVSKGPSPKSLNLVENFKHQPTFFAKLRFVAIYAFFRLGAKKCFFGEIVVFFGQELHHYMVYISYYTDLNFQL